MQPDVDLGRRRFLKTSGRAALAATARSLVPSTLAARDWSRAAAEEAGTSITRFASRRSRWRSDRRRSSKRPPTTARFRVSRFASRKLVTVGPTKEVLRDR
jgi:hypothetical protein